MMNLQDMYTDDVYFEDENGKRTGPYKTKFGSPEIIVYDESLAVTEDFYVIQPLPNGTEQRFVIIEISFSSGLGPINPHFTLQIKKEAKLKKEQQSVLNTTFHINNSNVQVGDGNVQNIINSFEQLIAEIANTNTEPKHKEEAKTLLKTLLNNPTVSAVLGGGVSGLLSLL